MMLTIDSWSSTNTGGKPFFKKDKVKYFLFTFTGQIINTVFFYLFPEYEAAFKPMAITILSLGLAAITGHVVTDIKTRVSSVAGNVLPPRTVGAPNAAPGRIR